MRRIASLTFILIATGCGGGGGGGTSSAPPAAPPPPGPPPGPTDPATALARPISPLTLCGTGLAKRATAVSMSQFVDVETSVGIGHWHAVAVPDWTREPGSLESVMRLGAVVATDTDDDCWPDFVFATGATASGQLVAYDNRAGTGFSQRLLNVVPSTHPIAGVGTADLDGDYRRDLLVGNLFAGSTHIYRASGAGSFTLAQSLTTTRSTFGFAVGDYSGDSWLDVHTAHWDLVPPPGAAAALWQNLGATATGVAGQLVAADAAAGVTPPAVPQDFNLAASFADLNGDRFGDLLIASDFGTSQVLLHTGSRAFAPLAGIATSDENASGQIVRDFDNDGYWDWLVASVHDPGDGRPWPWGRAGNRLYFGLAGPPYLAAAQPGTGIDDAEWPWGVCAEDFNNDGLVDLFVETGFGYAPDAVMAAQAGDPFVQQINASLLDKRYLRPRLFINYGNRQFVDESLSWGLSRLTNGRGVACVDYDRDGDVDIAVAQNSGPAILHENRYAGAGGYEFLAVRLVSIAPNTQAVGAVVTVEAGGRTQRRQLAANGSFQGQDGYQLHFGLAGADRADAVTVDWPDGTTSTLVDVPAGQFLTVINPRMLPYADSSRQTRIDAAITRALVYVAGPATLDNDLLLGLSWMQRMHALNLSYSPGDEINSRAAAAEAAGRSSLAAQLRTWRRLYDPLYQLSPDDYGQLSGFDVITFAAVYCHQYPLDDLDVLAIGDFAASGSYSTAHALLALLWAIDNDCPMPAAYTPALLANTVRDVYAVASAGGASGLTDLRVEAMALLAAAGRHDLIQADWVDQVLDAQLAGGGWRAAATEVGPSDHTTGLALWLLLQLAEENKVLSGFVAAPFNP